MGLALSTDVTNVVYGLVVVWNGSMVNNKVVSLCKQGNSDTTIGYKCGLRRLILKVE